MKNSEKSLHELEQSPPNLCISERKSSKNNIYQMVRAHLMCKCSSHPVNAAKSEKMTAKTYQLDSQVIRSVSEQTSVNLWRN